MTINHELLMKLKALAERGVDGEKINAQKILDKMLEKHGITMEDLEEESVQDHVLFFKLKQRRIVNQIIAWVMGNTNAIYDTNKKTAYIIECTKAQFVEIECKIDIYWKAFEKEQEKLLMAFFIKHGIFGERSNEKPTPEQVKEYMQAKQMSAGIDTVNDFKRLTP